MFFFDIESMFNNYDTFIEKDINVSNIFRYSELIKILEKYRNFCSISKIGMSTNKRKIFKMQWGIGKIKIFIWSQMHGNETTGTKSMFDIFNFFLKKENDKIVKFMKKKLTILFIPMLNPDGSEFFKRRNAVNIDLNRDAIKLQSIEMQILFKEIRKENPYILFNLHDQRSVFNVDNKRFNPAILSFLSPAIDRKNTNTISRIISMGVISGIVNKIKKLIPSIGGIGRYSDEYYPTATGDNLQKLGYSCILLEAGNYPGDIKKNVVRKYNAISIFSGFYFLSTNEENKIKECYRQYFTIKKNKSILLDKIYRKVKIQKNDNTFLVDIGLMKIEKFDIEKKNINSVLKIVDIGDLSQFFSYQEIISKNNKFYGKNGRNYPKIGEIEFFEFKVK
ncbi:M14 family zinc carboxypeptidase [Blattabacterium cuenoti]|uniref:M14 family zinc carboxypeptidase n=1 Tax=Blattabacterium cuenoti TaxID=1653831 RepID=UPI00163C84E0|nr:M14 family zinc carboxypeptidase [Blattabacterium cuenoti]